MLALDHRGFATARVIFDAGHARAIIQNAQNLHAFANRRAPHARALGQRHGDVGRVTLPVQRQMHRADHIADVQMRIHRLGLGRRDLVHVHPEATRQRGLAVDFLAPGFGQRHGDGAVLAHPGGNACLGLKLHVKIGGVFRQPGHVLAAAQLADQPRRVPGRAAGQLLAFQQHDVCPAGLGQMIRDRAAGHAASDNDNAGMGGQRHGNLRQWDGRPRAGDGRFRQYVRGPFRSSHQRLWPPVLPSP